MRQKQNILIGSIALVTFLTHLFTAGMLGYHRDEFLYIALGEHPAWGHWSNPPFIGWMSALSQLLFGESILAIHVLPALAGALMTWLCCLIVKELGGKNFAILLVGLGTLFHLSYLRTFSLFQPVPFDVLFWTFFLYLLVRYLHSDQQKYILILGAAIGFGMLNKYSILFFVLALILSTLLSSHRKILLTKTPYLAMGIGFIIFLPNLFWQYSYGFPVINHMQELSENQLQNVEPLNFIIDQFFMNWQGILLWLPGLWFLLASPKGKDFRLIGWIAIATVLLFLVFSGKSYYTLGVYPAVMAAGAVLWEQNLQRHWQRFGLAALIVLLILPLLPMALPLYKAERLENYFKENALDAALRWEDGVIHPLPQDYADMLGWQEIAEGTGKAFQQCDPQKKTFIYTENYGQAGAIEHLGKAYELPRPHSFSDIYLIWNEENTTEEVEQFIYVNDEMGEDVQEIFADIRIVDSVRNSRAREFGTKIYLCRQPKSSFRDFWNSRVKYVRELRGLPTTEPPTQ